MGFFAVSRLPEEALAMKETHRNARRGFNRTLGRFRGGDGKSCSVQDWIGVSENASNWLSSTDLLTQQDH